MKARWEDKMGMVERYLNSLAAHLPEDMRKDVRDELESTIQEQIEDRESQLGRKLNTTEVEEILKQLGHPMKVASAYLPNQHLIGTEAFPAYKRALKLSLAWVLGIRILAMLPFFITGRGLFQGLSSITGTLFTYAVWVFAVVTAVFYLLERSPKSLEGLYKWSPERLKEKKPHLRISRLETGFELFIEVAFLSWWNGLWHFPATMNSQVQMQIGMSPHWSAVFWAVNGLGVLTLLITLYKYAKGGWNGTTLTGGILIGLGELAIVYRILSFDSLTVLSGGAQDPVGMETLARVAEVFARSVVWLIAVIIVLEMADSVRKLIRLSKSR
jgi:hypothetical protein